MFVLSFIVVVVCGPLLGNNSVPNYLLFTFIYIAVGPPFIKRRVLGSILLVLTPLHVCSKQGLPTFYVVVLFISWGEKRLFRFVDIGEIAFHRHLNFLYIMKVLFSNICLFAILTSHIIYLKWRTNLLKPKGQSGMNNPETQATLSTKHRIKTNKTKTYNTEN